MMHGRVVRGRPPGLALILLWGTRGEPFVGFSVVSLCHRHNLIRCGGGRGRDMMPSVPEHLGLLQLPTHNISMGLLSTCHHAVFNFFPDMCM